MPLSTVFKGSFFTYCIFHLIVITYHGDEYSKKVQKGHSSCSKVYLLHSQWQTVCICCPIILPYKKQTQILFVLCYFNSFNCIPAETRTKINHILYMKNNKSLHWFFPGRVCFNPLHLPLHKNLFSFFHLQYSLAAGPESSIPKVPVVIITKNML